MKSPWCTRPFSLLTVVNNDHEGDEEGHLGKEGSETEIEVSPLFSISLTGTQPPIQMGSNDGNLYWGFRSDKDGVTSVELMFLFPVYCQVNKPRYRLQPVFHSNVC